MRLSTSLWPVNSHHRHKDNDYQRPQILRNALRLQLFLAFIAERSGYRNARLVTPVAVPHRPFISASLF